MDETPPRHRRPTGPTDATARTVLIVVVTVLALVVVLGPLLVISVMLLGTGGMMGSGMIGPGMMGGMMGQPNPIRWRGVVIAVSWLLVAVGVLLLLIWGVRRFANRGTTAAEETPLAILQRRYARGEIGPEEYERIRADLLRDGVPQ